MGRRFNVRPPRLRSASEEIYGYSRQAVQVSNEILDISRRLGNMSGMGEVCRCLKQLSEDAGKEAGVLRAASDATVRIGTLYDKSENNIFVNGDKSRQKFPLHKVTVWGADRPWKIPFERRIIR